MSVALWRIGTDTPTYTADDLSGAGAKLSGGRWNEAGLAVVYSSGSISLACLETLVHLASGSLPLNRYLVRIDVPDEIFERREVFEKLGPDAARVGWDAQPAGKVSIDMGSQWVRAQREAILEVPSVIVHEERNYLLNPLHPDAAAIIATKLRRFEYDGRLF